jgi:hypothetical protein
MNVLIEINENEYLQLLEDKRKLQEKVDRMEMAIFGTLRVFDKLIKDTQE